MRPASASSCSTPDASASFFSPSRLTRSARSGAAPAGPAPGRQLPPSLGDLLLLPGQLLGAALESADPLRLARGARILQIAGGTLETIERGAALAGGAG